MTTSEDLGQNFVDHLVSKAADNGHIALSDYAAAVRETVEPIIRGVLDDTDAAPLATQQHVDELLAEIMAALGKDYAE